jgi:N-acetylneuraminic acid mutarotase
MSLRHALLVSCTLSGCSFALLENARLSANANKIPWIASVQIANPFTLSGSRVITDAEHLELTLESETNAETSLQISLDPQCLRKMGEPVALTPGRNTLDLDLPLEKHWLLEGPVTLYYQLNSGQQTSSCESLTTPYSYRPDRPERRSSVLPPGREGSASVLWRQFLIVLGGTAPTGALRDIFAYDTDLNVWKEIIPLTGSITANLELAQAVLHENKIFVFGSATNNSLHTFDLIESQWSQAVSTTGTAPSTRTYFSWRVVGDYAYLFGGRNPSNVRLNDLYRLNLLTLHWEALSPSGTAPTIRDSAAMGYHDGRLYIVGGANASSGLTDVTAYDIELNSWGPSLAPSGSAPPTSFFGTPLMWVQNGTQLYLQRLGKLSGGPHVYHTLTGELHRLDLASLTWGGSDLSSGDSNAPRASTGSRGAMQIKDGKLYVWGGAMGSSYDHRMARYDIGSAQWEPLLRPKGDPTELLGSGLHRVYALPDNKILLLDPAYSGTQSRAAILDLYDYSWTILSPTSGTRPDGLMFDGNPQGSTLYLDGKVYWFGGQKASYSGGMWMNDWTNSSQLYVYDVAANAWTGPLAGPTGTGTAEAALYAWEGSLYVIGGVDSNWSALQQVHRYDLQSEQWQTHLSGSSGVSADIVLSNTAQRGSKIYFHSGLSLSGGSVAQRFDILDLQTQTWTSNLSSALYPLMRVASIFQFTPLDRLVLGGGWDFMTVTYGDTSLVDAQTLQSVSSPQGYVNANFAGARSVVLGNKVFALPADANNYYLRHIPFF